MIILLCNYIRNNLFNNIMYKEFIYLNIYNVKKLYNLFRKEILMGVRVSVYEPFRFLFMSRSSF